MRAGVGAALALLTLLSAPALLRAEVEEGGVVQLPPAKVERLVINHPQGSLTLRGWDNNEVSISFHKRAASPALLEVLRVQVDMSGDGVMRIRSGIESRGELRGLPQADGIIDLTVDAPRGAPLLASTFNGALSVSGFQNDVDVGSQTGALRINNVTGTVRTHTGSGDQWLRAISGDVDARGVIGALRFHAMAGPSLSAQVVSGEITAQDIRSQLVHLHAVAGAIYLLGVLQTTARYDLLVDEGNIQVTLPPAPLPRFTIDAAAPRIQAAFPLDRGALSGPGVLRGTVRGGGPSLRLQSGSGQITLIAQ